MDNLQWFKFNPSAWMMGKIQRCEEVTQARFTRLCCLYWVKGCEMTIEDAIIEIDQAHFDSLKSKKIITVSENSIFISFLDEQFLEIKEEKQDKSKSGIVGNLKRWHKGIYDKFIAKEISLEKAIQLSKIIAEPSHTDNEPIATQSQIIADKEEEQSIIELETEQSIIEKENKNNTEGVISDQLKIDPPPEKIDFIKFQKFFNDNRKNLAEVKKMTDARKKRLKSLESQYGKACLMHCVEKARDSDFLQGINSKNWLASFDWIFTPANFIKILEDNYANRQQQSGKTNAEIYTDAVNSELGQSFNWGK